MDIVMLPTDPEALTQSFTMDVKPNGKLRTLRVELVYRVYAEKYFATVTDAVTGKDILRNFPLVGSRENVLNDLLKQVSYKLCGAFVCYPLLNNTAYPDPNDNMDEFELLWGDSPWQS